MTNQISVFKSSILVSFIVAILLAWPTLAFADNQMLTTKSQIGVSQELVDMGNKIAVKPDSSLSGLLVPGIYDNISKKYVGYFCVQKDGTISTGDVGKKLIYCVVDLDHMKANQSHSDYSVKYTTKSNLNFKNKDITHFELGQITTLDDGLHIFVSNSGKLLGGKYLIGTKLKTEPYSVSPMIAWGGVKDPAEREAALKFIESNDLDCYSTRDLYSPIANWGIFDVTLSYINSCAISTSQLRTSLRNGWQYQDSYWKNIGNIGNNTIFKRVASGIEGYSTKEYGDVSAKYGIYYVNNANTQMVNWKRLWGQKAIDTMQVIVNEGWSETGGTVVIANSGGFRDALSSSGVAGLENAPILLVDKNSVPAQTETLLRKLKPKKVIVAGGPAAIAISVESDLKKITGVTPIRHWGQKASDTAAALNKAYAGKWKDGIAIVATSAGFRDALSASPVSYVKHYPIFLADGRKTITDNTISSMKTCGIKQVIVVGGPMAVGDEVVDKLRKNGISLKTRLWGQTAYDTNKAIVDWALKNGMTTTKMGVATINGWRDAVCGGPLCGKNNSVLFLVSDSQNANAINYAANYKKSISEAYVFGGWAAVSDSVFDKLKNATKGS